MMRYVIIGTFVFLGIVGVGFAFVTLLTSDLDGGSEVGDGVQKPTSTFPAPAPAQKDVPASVSNTFQVTARGGNTIRVLDFRNREDVEMMTTDTGGDYYILPPKSRNTFQSQGYSITFWQRAEVFNITINSEPYGGRQQDAEQELMGILGLTQDAFCQLRFSIQVARLDGTYMEIDEPLICRA